MRQSSLRSLTFALLPAVVLVASGCTDEKIVFRDRAPFNQPVDSINGFLGYYTVSAGKTNCGNCHVQTQAQWAPSAHASAYRNLLNAVPNPPATCFNCHTVNQNGNALALTAGATGGWTRKQDSTYRDVQCESCHGAGLRHATNPEATANWPLARVDVVDTAASCGGCHNDTHHPFIEQWSQSGHANQATADAEGGNASCAPCHEGRTAMERFGGPSNYVEKSGAAAAKKVTIVCATSHDPHGSPNEGQLRLSVQSQEISTNLCSACHFRNTTPTGTFGNSTATVTRRGAHASQGGVFFGNGAGWIPPGFVYDTNRVFSSHASSTANPRLCAGCHVKAYPINDPTSGNFVFQSVGHLFLPIPCKDANGLPTGNKNCAYDATSRFWNACTGSGCHADANVAVSLFTNERQTIKNLVETLWKDDGVLNSGGEPYISPATDTGLLPFILNANLDDPVCKKNGVATKAFDATDNCISAAEGALWNAMMLAENLYDHNDGSKGVHNPFYYEALLAASIQNVRASYPGLPAVQANVQQQITNALSRPGFAFVAPAQLQASR